MDEYTISNIPMLILVAILIVAAIKDLRSRRIPNALTYPTVAAALLYYFLLFGLNGLIFSVLGLLTGIFLLILPYLMGGMGAGDAKLMGAVGAIVGAKGVFLSFLLTAIIGGFCAIFTIFIQRHQFKGFFGAQLIRIKLFVLTGKIDPDGWDARHKRPKLCYAPAIALGSIAYIALNMMGYPLPI